MLFISTGGSDDKLCPQILSVGTTANAALTERMKCLFPKFESFYFSSNFNAVLCEVFILMGYCWTLKKFATLFRKGSKRGPISEM
jgi:hypothetical protein